MWLYLLSILGLSHATHWGPFDRFRGHEQDTGLFIIDNDAQLYRAVQRYEDLFKPTPDEPCNRGQFTQERTALLLHPGTYTKNVLPMGYYTSVDGMGAQPEDVTVSIHCSEACPGSKGGALCTFWRSLSHVRVPHDLTWATSQASPLRHITVDGTISLSEQGYSSGGYMEHVHATSLNTGTQQQYFIRDSTFDTGEVPYTAFNTVLVNTSINGEIVTLNDASLHAYSGSHNWPTTTKARIEVDPGTNEWYVVIPSIVHQQHTQVDRVKTILVPTDIIGPSDVLPTFCHRQVLVFLPGIYDLTDSIQVSDHCTIIGLGYATFVHPTNQPAMIIQGDCIHITGILFDSRLNTVEIPLSTMVHVRSGTFISLVDIYARVGGGVTNTVGNLDSMVHVEASSVILDHLWLWRADHQINSELVYNHRNWVTHALRVTGQDNIAFGLFAEHSVRDNIMWKGKGGQLVFLQSELAYDGNDPSVTCVWSDYYLYHGGSGCYLYNRDNNIHIRNAFVNPNPQEHDHYISVFLDGLGGLEHILNNDGKGVNLWDRISTYP